MDDPPLRGGPEDGWGAPRLDFGPAHMVAGGVLCGVVLAAFAWIVLPAAAGGPPERRRDPWLAGLLDAPPPGARPGRSAAKGGDWREGLPPDLPWLESEARDDEPAPGGETGPARAPAAGLAFRVPVQGVARGQLVDTWGAARGKGRRHEGIDIMAPRGTPVLAAVDGTVVRIRRSGPGGNTIYQLGERGRLLFYYAHLDRWAPGLEAGDEVEAGQVIAYVGDTGNAGPGVYHLHFEVSITADPQQWWGGISLNPYWILVGQP